ncbi:MAG: tetratricopeptide repeat protein, partial [Phaeodactylibacter sp.]|nr:tetratricopeptide repeat protein [Phaeodactylibacter sp.]
MKPFLVLISVLFAVLRGLAQAPSDPLLKNLLDQYDKQFHTGQLEEALTSIREADSLLRLSPDPDELTAASIKYNYGMTLIHLERAPEALPLFQKALELQEGVWGAEDPGIVRALAWLGKTYAHLGQFAEGEQQLLRAQAILEKEKMTAGLAYADLMSDFTHLYFLQGNLEAAGTHAEQSLAVREAAARVNDRNYAEILQSLAMIANRLGDYQKAETYFKRAKPAFVQAVGA